MQTCDETGSLRQCVEEWVCEKLDKYYIYMNVKFFPNRNLRVDSYGNYH